MDCQLCLTSYGSVTFDLQIMQLAVTQPNRSVIAHRRADKHIHIMLDTNTLRTEHFEETIRDSWEKCFTSSIKYATS